MGTRTKVCSDLGKRLSGISISARLSRLQSSGEIGQELGAKIRFRYIVQSSKSWTSPEMTVFIFLLLFHLPSFGGDVRVEWTFTELEGCQRLRRVILKQMDDLTMRYTPTECEAKEVPAK